MPNADNAWTVGDKLLLVPAAVTAAAGLYLAVSDGTTGLTLSLTLGAALLASGVWLWIQMCFFREARIELQKMRAHADSFEEKSEMLEARAQSLQRQVELLTAQREVSRVASSEVTAENPESLLYEIIRVINNLMHVEDATEVLVIGIFLNDETGGAIKAAAVQREDSVAFGDDIDTSGIDLSLIDEVQKHRTIVSTVEKNSVGFAMPLVADQEWLGVLYVEVIMHGEREKLGDHIAVLQGFLTEMSRHVSIPLMKQLLKSTSVTDGLTRLHNKSYFLDRLQEYFAMARRGEFELSLLMIDIDFFKKINDEYGHLAGDAVLVQVSELITKTLRTYDVAYSGFRYGGEEISVLLPRTTATRALPVAKRLRKDLADTGFAIPDERTIQVTISIGLAQATTKMKKKEELIARADNALYRAKRTGRNRVCAWKEGE